MTTEFFNELLPLFQKLKFEVDEDREGWYVDCADDLPCNDCTKAFNRTACSLSARNTYLTPTQLQKLQDTYPEEFI